MDAMEKAQYLEGYGAGAALILSAVACGNGLVGVAVVRDMALVACDEQYWGVAQGLADAALAGEGR